MAIIIDYTMTVEDPGEYPELPTAASLFTMEHSIAPYQSWNLRAHYQWHEGVIHCPVAAAPGTGFATRPPASSIRVHAPYGFLRIRGTAERIGKEPVQPNPVRTDPNLVLLHFSFVPMQPDLDALGTVRTFRSALEIDYGLRQPVTVVDGRMYWPTSPTDGGAAIPVDGASFTSAPLGS